MWVSQVLGHQDPVLTLRTYAHVLERENDDLRFFDREEGRVEPAPNPFVPGKVLTMSPE
jgi:hypothetical protein